jgi:hypothetical protein
MGRSEAELTLDEIIERAEARDAEQTPPAATEVPAVVYDDLTELTEVEETPAAPEPDAETKGLGRRRRVAAPVPTSSSSTAPTRDPGRAWMIGDRVLVRRRPAGPPRVQKT